MDSFPLKSASRCPHCKTPLIPWRKDGGRYTAHVNSCPMNPRGNSQLVSKNSSKPQKIKFLGPFKRRRLQKIGELLMKEDKDNFVLICRECWRSRLSIMPDGHPCDCGSRMIRAEFVIEEIRLDSQSLPKNF